MKKRLVIGLSGASGAPLGIELLRGMQYFPDWETHLVYSSSFVKTLAYESSLSLEDVCHLADQVYPLDDVAASVSRNLPHRGYGHHSMQHENLSRYCLRVF